jgi:hypothetical protein
MMTVGELRKALEGEPDDMPVMIGDEVTCAEVIGTNADCDVGEEKPAFLIEVSDELGEAHVAMIRATTPA